MPQLILLLGPNGVGKTTVGQALQQQYDCTFVGIEQFFPARYPREEELSWNMEAAAEAFKEHLLEKQRVSRHPVVFEETRHGDHPHPGSGDHLSEARELVRAFLDDQCAACRHVEQRL